MQSVEVFSNSPHIFSRHSVGCYLAYVFQTAPKIDSRKRYEGSFSLFSIQIRLLFSVILLKDFGVAVWHLFLNLLCIGRFSFRQLACVSFCAIV
jgi:hypothetical protein